MGAGETWAIILAAGSGRRFGAAKQFERIDGVRLVDRAIDLARPHVAGIVLALPDGVEWDGARVELTAVGGATHAESTRRALAALPEHVASVLISAPSHPLIPSTLFSSVLAALQDDTADAAVPLLPLADAVKVDDGVQVRSVPTERRPSVAQLPFAVRRAALDRAAASVPEFTEELAAIEALGGRIVGVDGDPGNIHVATPADFALATLILRHR